MSKNTIETKHSHLNKASIQLYDRNLRTYPRVYDFIKFCDNGVPTKKAAVFEVEELGKFFSEVDLGNKYALVRTCFSSMAFFGGNRVIEMKGLTFGGNL